MLQSKSIGWLATSFTLATLVPFTFVHGQDNSQQVPVTAPEAGPCPHQFMFAFGTYYYYCITNCPTGHQSGYLIFDKQVDTGCKDTSCACQEDYYARMTETEDTGGVAATPFVPLHKDTVMLRPTPAPNIAVTVGFPKYIKAKVDGAERTFLVYKGSWLHGVNTSPYLVGVELTGLPSEETPTIEGEVESANDTLVKLKVGSDTFKCLFKK